MLSDIGNPFARKLDAWVPNTVATKNIWLIYIQQSQENIIIRKWPAIFNSICLFSEILWFHVLHTDD
jgi:hypothetical protein